MKIHIKQVYDMVVDKNLSVLDTLAICKMFNTGKDEQCFLCNSGGELKIRRVIG